MWEWALQYISKMRLPGGVVGKTSKVLIFMVIAMAGIVWAIRTELIAVLALVLMAGVVLVVARWIINFADRHPQAALYEGAEFLRHEQLLASKTNPNIVARLEDFTEAHCTMIPDKDRTRLMQPDVPAIPNSGVPPNLEGGTDE